PLSPSPLPLHDALPISGTPIAIYAGNSSAFPQVAQVLKPVTEVRSVPNLRPGLTSEQTGPAEEAIANLYRERRVPQIPGYPVLSDRKSTRLNSSHRTIS